MTGWRRPRELSATPPTQEEALAEWLTRNQKLADRLTRSHVLRLGYDAETRTFKIDFAGSGHGGGVWEIARQVAPDAVRIDCYAFNVHDLTFKKSSSGVWRPYLVKQPPTPEAMPDEPLF